MVVVRRVGALVLAAAAVAVWFLLAPAEEAEASADFSSDIDDALAEYELNSATATSAPQQEVVNGWVAKDLLEVVAEELNASLSPTTAPSDDRVPAELLLVVLGVALLAFTQPGGQQPSSPGFTGPAPGPGAQPESASPGSGRRIKQPSVATKDKDAPPTG